MQQCVIFTKDDYKSIKHSLQVALLDIKEMCKAHPCYAIGRIEQLVEEAYDVLVEEECDD